MTRIMNNSDWQWQQQQQLQMEQIAVLQLWCNNRQQRRTNDLLEQNNQLLEKIRRLQLTPAERAKEDAQRAAAHARLAAERARDIKCGGVLLLGLGLVVLALFLWGKMANVANHPNHPVASPAIETAAPASQPTHDWAPRAELVRQPSN